jgi:cell division protein YceG involved in septum cleavage
MNGGTGRKRIGEILSARGYVTETRIVQLLSRGENAGKKIGEILIAEGYVTDDILASALKEQRDGESR